MKFKSIITATGIMLFLLLIENGAVVCLEPLRKVGYIFNMLINLRIGNAILTLGCSAIFLYFTNFWKLIKIKQPNFFKLCLYIFIIILFLYIISLWRNYSLAPDRYYFVFSNVNWLLIIIYFTYYPIVEEVFFRGVSIEYLIKNKIPTWTIILLTSVLFAIPHIIGYSLMYGFKCPDLVEFFFVAIIFAVVYLRERNLIYCIVMHAVINLLSVAHLL